MHAGGPAMAVARGEFDQDIRNLVQFLSPKVSA